MKLVERGINTSKVEVLNVSPNGVWLSVKGQEHFLPYDEFPWFQSARLAEIQRVQLLHGRHLYWDRLDVDLDLDSLDQPSHFPLIYR